MPLAPGNSQRIGSFSQCRPIVSLIVKVGPAAKQMCPVASKLTHRPAIFVVNAFIVDLSMWFSR